MFWNMLMRRSGRSRGGAQDGVRGQTDLNGGERKALAGVGIVFVKAPDESLFVKDMVAGSGACSSGIQIGDCLMEVDGKRVYCKGVEKATQLILGQAGTVVSLKLMRVNPSGKREPVSANLVRELKATADPTLSVTDGQGYTSGVATKQVFLQCLQDDSAATVATPVAADLSLGGPALFGRDAPGNKQRKVLFKGKWYTEEEIEGLEAAAHKVKQELHDMEHGRAAGTPAGEGAAAGGVGTGGMVARGVRATQSLPPERVKSAAPVAAQPSMEEGFLSSPQALQAAIFVVGGGPVKKVSSTANAWGSYLRKVDVKLFTRGVLRYGNKEGHATWAKRVDLKVFTGGVLRWGKKEGRVMWGKSVKEQYDPNMTKKDFTTLQCKFQVMLEGKKILAHTAAGNVEKAVEAEEALLFVAPTPEARDMWVMGINSLLLMVNKEAKARAEHIASVQAPASVDQVEATHQAHRGSDDAVLFGGTNQAADNEGAGRPFRPPEAATKEGASRRDSEPEEAANKEGAGPASRQPAPEVLFGIGSKGPRAPRASAEDASPGDFAFFVSPPPEQTEVHFGTLGREEVAARDAVLPGRKEAPASAAPPPSSSVALPPARAAPAAAASRRAAPEEVPRSAGHQAGAGVGGEAGGEGEGVAAAGGGGGGGKKEKKEGAGGGAGGILRNKRSLPVLQPHAPKTSSREALAPTPAPAPAPAAAAAAGDGGAAGDDGDGARRVVSAREEGPRHGVTDDGPAS
ncbi:hypothetical protein T484DRAFT_1908817, partial [Baffinella frigidus]